MGLDVYAGQLTRYYGRSWDTIVQQQAKETGVKCILTVVGGEEIKPVEDQNEIAGIRETISGWLNNVADGLNITQPRPLWDETKECGYYTDKPDWDAFNALIMLLSCCALKSPLPEFIEGGFCAYDEPVVKEAMEKGINSSLLSGVELWLPIDARMIFSGPNPNGDEASMSTVSLLKKELDDLNSQLWQADEATILSWRDDKYYFPVNIKKPKPLFGIFLKKHKKSKAKYRTEDLAQCAFSVLYQAILFAQQNHVPILLDY